MVRPTTMKVIMVMRRIALCYVSSITVALKITVYEEKKRIRFIDLNLDYSTFI